MGRTPCLPRMAILQGVGVGIKGAAITAAVDISRDPGNGEDRQIARQSMPRRGMEVGDPATAAPRLGAHIYPPRVAGEGQCSQTRAKRMAASMATAIATFSAERRRFGEPGHVPENRTMPERETMAPEIVIPLHNPMADSFPQIESGAARKARADRSQKGIAADADSCGGACGRSQLATVMRCAEWPVKLCANNPAKATKCAIP
jgi:hypothetical protein